MRDMRKVFASMVAALAVFSPQAVAATTAETSSTSAEDGLLNIVCAVSSSGLLPASGLVDAVNQICGAWKNAQENYNRLAKELEYYRRLLESGLFQSLESLARGGYLDELDPSTRRKALTAAYGGTESEAQAKLEETADALRKEIQSILDQATKDPNPDLEAVKSDIQEKIEERGGKVLEFVDNYINTRSQEVENKRKELEATKNAYRKALAKVQDLSLKKGMDDPDTQSAIAALKAAQADLAAKQREYAKIARAASKEYAILSRVSNDLNRAVLEAQRKVAGQTAVLGAQKGAEALIRDESLKKLGDQVQQASEELWKEAQNATSTRAAVQLLARGLGQIANTQVASTTAIQKALGDLATQQVYTNQQLALLTEQIAAQQASELQQAAAEVEYEMANIIASGESVTERLSGVLDFKKAYGAMSCSKWWVGDCGNGQ
mgnify:CR=1 FL=1